MTCSTAGPARLQARPAPGSMRWPRRYLYMVLLASLLVAGCGSSTNVSISVSPATITMLVGTTETFTANLTNSSNTVTWSVNGIAATSTADGGTIATGFITSGGVYTAPVTFTPNTTITITASITDPNMASTATVTLASGASTSITNSSNCSIGTNETYQFTAAVTGVPATSGIPPNDVTWAVTSGTGTIDPNAGLFTAPGGAESDTITATSVYDPSQVATITVTIVAAADPAFAGLSPNAGARGALFQDIYVLAGANFVCTTTVLVNSGNITLPAPNTITASSSTLIARLYDTFLDQFGSQVDSSGNLTLTLFVERQGGAPQACGNGGASCQVVLSPVRPAIVGTSPNAIPTQGTLATIDGGFFGTTATNLVTLSLGNQVEPFTLSGARQITATLTPPGNPGLYPLTVRNAKTQAEAVANIAVQPASASVLPSPLPVGTGPSAVAVDTSTGIAVVANAVSNDVTLINMNATPAPAFASLCTGVTGQLSGSPSSPCPTSGPAGVAVDNLRHIALVANTANNAISCAVGGSVAVVDISTPTSPSVLSIICPDQINNISGRGPVPSPIGVGVNPVTGRGIIVYQGANGDGGAGFGTLLDLTPIDQSRTNPPAFVGSVTMSTGTDSRVAVSPKLNWALATPGSGGGLSIVDLNRQNVYQISGASQSGGVVTATTTTAVALNVGDAVLVQCLADPTYNGEFNVSSVPSSTTFTYSQYTTQASTPPSSTPPCNVNGATASFADPVATLSAPTQEIGISINDETQQAIIADDEPSTDAGAWAQIFNPLNQTFSTVQNQPFTSGGSGTEGAAFDPLNDIAVVTNQSNDAVSIIDPSTPTSIQTPLTGGGISGPVDVAIDPATNSAIVANYGSGSGSTVSIISLGTSFTSAPQVLQVSLCADSACSHPAVSGPTTSGPSVVIFSSLTSGAQASAQTLEIVGANLTSGSTVQMDGTALATTCPTSGCNGRELIATVPASLLTGPRRFALQVANGSNISNAASFTVIQSVDVSGGCVTSAPQGVAIDSANNLVSVSDPGCNTVAVVNLANGTGWYPSPVALTGTNPQGLGVLPYSGLIVVAEENTNTADIIDEIGGTGIEATVSPTDASPTAVGIDLGLGDAVIAASSANVLDLFPVNSTPGAPTTFGTGGGPDAVAVDPTLHNVVVGDANSNSVSVVSLDGGSPSQPTAQVSLPTGVAFDPSSGDFFVTQSTANSVIVLNLSTLQTPSFGVGINPTSIAYNFNTSTLVTANFLSHTMTVADLENPAQPNVRAVLSVSPSSQFAVDIHPLTNIAVLAESTPQGAECVSRSYGCILLLPLPR